VSFDDLVGGDDLTPEEEARLRQVHELLVQAGPPPDLPPALEQPVRPDDAEVVQFPLLMRRRLAVGAIAAAAAVLVAFAIGFAVGHAKGKTQPFAAEHVVPMHGTPGRQAVIQIAKADGAGNWPMQVVVDGLPQQANRKAYYELWLTTKGKPAVSCGTFRVHGGTTTVQLSVPYKLSRYDGWVVTAQSASDRGIGPVVLTT